jgi:hypothetical protein
MSTPLYCAIVESYGPARLLADQSETGDAA